MEFDVCAHQSKCVSVGLRLQSTKQTNKVFPVSVWTGVATGTTGNQTAMWDVLTLNSGCQAQSCCQQAPHTPTCVSSNVSNRSLDLWSVYRQTLKNTTYESKAELKVEVKIKATKFKKLKRQCSSGIQEAALILYILCVYTCVYTEVYDSIYLYKLVCSPIYLFVLIHTCLYLYMPVYTCVCICIYLCMYQYIPLYTSI